MRASLVASPTHSGFCNVGPVFLDMCVSERERRQALNPRGHMCLENTTLIEPRQADLAWVILPFTELIKKTVNSTRDIQVLTKEIPFLFLLLDFEILTLCQKAHLSVFRKSLKPCLGSVPSGENTWGG